MVSADRMTSPPLSPTPSVDELRALKQLAAIKALPGCPTCPEMGHPVLLPLPCPHRPLTSAPAPVGSSHLPTVAPPTAHVQSFGCPSHKH